MNKSQELLSNLSIEEKFKVGQKLSVDWDGPSNVEVTAVKSGEVTIKRIGGENLPPEFQTLTLSVKDLKSMLDESVQEAKDDKTSEVISTLIDTSWSGSNEEQMKAVQLLKGIALSDSPEANAFMKKLDTFTSGITNKDIKNEDYTEYLSLKGELETRKIISVLRDMIGATDHAESKDLDRALSKALSIAIKIQR